MSLDLLNLDDRTYADLVEEARSLIPSLAPEWTDFNPGDPGITLIELFAWLTEMLLYRANRLPEQNVHTFLKLLNGPSWTPGEDLDEDVRATVLDLRRRQRAVTGDDYEVLAREASPDVARARSIARRDLSALTEDARTAPRPGYVSVIVVPERQPALIPPAPLPLLPPLPATGLLPAVHDYLEPRRLLTVRNVVVGPIYTPIQPRIVLARRPEVDPEDLRQRAAAAVRTFLDPLLGGGDVSGGKGWPFGRDVYVSEIYQLLEALPGVDYVPDVTLASAWPDFPGAFPPELRCVPATPLWHDSGDPIGLGLEAHHLPWARFDPAALANQIAIGTVFVPIRVEVTAVLGSAIAPVLARQAVQAKVLSLFHPLGGGPREGRASSADVVIEDGQIADKVVELYPDVVGVLLVQFDAPADHLSAIPGGFAVRLGPGELADCRVDVTLEAGLS